MIHRDNRTKQRFEARQQAVAELKAAGWEQGRFGFWFEPGCTRFGYSTKAAIERMRQTAMNPPAEGK